MTLTILVLHGQGVVHLLLDVPDGELLLGSKQKAESHSVPVQ